MDVRAVKHDGYFMALRAVEVRALRYAEPAFLLHEEAAVFTAQEDADGYFAALAGEAQAGVNPDMHALLVVCNCPICHNITPGKLRRGFCITCLVCAKGVKGMPISDKAWGSISESDYKDAETFCKACLIDLNEPGAEKVKAKCKLPVREPGGAVNRNALAAAAAALAGARGGVQAPLEAKRAAARKLVRLYAEAEMEPPASLKRLAGVK